MMDKTERNAVWHESVERFGTRLQSVVCMEECAELIQAVSKRLRGKPDPEDNLAEEMADVYICLGMLRDMYGVTDERLESWIDRADGRLEVGVREARLAGLELESDGRSGPEGDAAMAEACSKASAVRTGDERLALLLELARTDLLPGGVARLERLRDA